MTQKLDFTATMTQKLDFTATTKNCFSHGRHLSVVSKEWSVCTPQPELRCFFRVFLAYILKIHEQKLLCNFVALIVQNKQLQKLQCAQQDPARF